MYALARLESMSDNNFLSPDHLFLMLVSTWQIHRRIRISDDVDASKLKAHDSGGHAERFATAAQMGR